MQAFADKETESPGQGVERMEKMLLPCILNELDRFRNNRASSMTFEKTLEGDESLPLEFKFRLAKADPNMSRSGIVAVLTDVTTRKRALEECSRLATIINTTDDAIISIDHDATIRTANKGAETIYGYSSAELLGHSVYVMVPDSRKEEMAAILAKCAAGESTSRFETYRKRRNGEIFPVSVTYSPIFQGDNVQAMSAISRDISERKRVEHELKDSHGRLNNLLEETVKALSTTLEQRDLYTAGHQLRVSMCAQAIAVRMGLDRNDIQAIRMAGLLHDIGKIRIPMAILNKPGRLSPSEMALVRDHPETGLDITKNIPFPWPVGQIIHQHHERLDGSGYPNGVMGEDLCIGARIIAVADVLEAMSSHRPYRPALGLELALDTVMGMRGTAFDRNVCDALKDLIATGTIMIRQGGLQVCP